MSVVVVVRQPIHPLLITGVNITTPLLTPVPGTNYTLTANIEPVGANSPQPFTYAWYQNATATGTRSGGTASTQTFGRGTSTTPFFLSVRVTDSTGNEFVGVITINPNG